MKRIPKGWQSSGDQSTGGHESGSDSEATFKIPDVPKPSTGVEEVRERDWLCLKLPPWQVADWAAEVRPSMRKLRQGMDSLLKTSRLMCSVLRLQQVLIG